MRRIMKHLLLLSTILVALSTPAYAATVTIKTFANDVRATTSGGFSQTPGGTALSTNSEIQSIIASDPATAIFGTSMTDYSVIQLGFAQDIVITGAGTDLVVFSLWYGEGNNYDFGLQAFAAGAASTDPISNLNYHVTGNSLFTGDCAITNSSGGCSAYISAIAIDLYDNNGLAPLADGIEIDYIQLLIGGAYNGSGPDAYSNFSLAGAFNVKTAVVPLPLSVVLFSSGLALLGWTGRRKKV